MAHRWTCRASWSPSPACICRPYFFRCLLYCQVLSAKDQSPVTAMNSKIDNTIHERNLLEKAGLATVDVSAWLAARHELRNDFGADSRACSDYWDLGQKLRAQLPKRAAR